MVNCALSLGAKATGFRLSRSQSAAGTVSDHPANPWIGKDPAKPFSRTLQSRTYLSSLSDGTFSLILVLSSGPSCPFFDRVQFVPKNKASSSAHSEPICAGLYGLTMQQSFPARSEATAIVALRFVSRAVIVKRLGIDDWTMMLATITAILNVAIAGLGKHDGTLSKVDELPAAKIRYITHIIYTPITGLIKTSICLLYLRLFPNLRKITLGTIAFIAAMSIAIILATIFQCWPVDAVYNPQKYDHYTCFASIPFWYATAALSLVTDLWILGLPIRTILGLQIGSMKRVVVIGLLSLGTLLPCSACIASIVRMVYIIKLYESNDPSWSTFGVSVSSGIEVAVAIIAASLPSTKPVMDLIFPRLFSTSADKSHTTSAQVYHNRTSARGHRQHDDISLVHLTMECDSGKDDSTTGLSRA
ncbi:hypothetical protein M747DRAFT_240792 [Aspergillus niger ATCC 13496]|uniref:Rhodopsin domain-containing protein n=1 Tax=Aspergillus niger ATCC 13496 TaxID=1353008 RepID=A0A370BYJ0_ASPNG|nr:hypothetical protein M747DRAFT_240792 [Aspergillus niger ATCC 13496]